MNSSTTPEAPATAPASHTISAGMALLEAAIVFFETVEGGKYATLTKILNAALVMAKMI
jgi:hypothetical protein